MIIVLSPRSSKRAGLLVTAALRRSVSFSQVRLFSGGTVSMQDCDVIVAINPDSEITNHLSEALRRNQHIKVILFGSLTQELLDLMNLRPRDWPKEIAVAGNSKKASIGKYAESDAYIGYTNLASRLGSKSWRRALERFDFADEWNNLGYGAVRTDQSDWGVSMAVQANELNSIAEIFSSDFAGLAYSAIADLDNSSILWFNRCNGCIDSFEWRIVENFLSSWRNTSLRCVPVIREIPYGYDCCVTMRLDCDENIESARDLRQEYFRLGVPFSLAIHTRNLDDPSQHYLLKEMASNGESILSHSATHASNWGG